MAAASSSTAPTRNWWAPGVCTRRSTKPSSEPRPATALPNEGEAVSDMQQRGAKFREALESLNLTPEQQTQVRDAVMSARAGGAQPERGAVMQKLAGILTAEQQA